VIPHSDGAGTVDRVGEGVATSRLGERVWIWNAQWKRPFGSAAEFITLPSEQAVPLSEKVSFEAGACLGIPALTAYRAVTADASPQGQTILVTGGAGAVGHYAIQFAKILGAKKIITTISSREKAEHARAAGADTVINYREEPVVDRIRDATNGEGVDRIVEVDASTNAPLLPQVVARDGLCVVYGSSAPEINYGFGPLILSGAAVRFFIVYELTPSVRAKAIQDLTEWMERDYLSHTIAARFTLDDIAAAHEAVERGDLIGNVIVTPR
jgi:NADPH2:quinone reductase